MRLRIIRLCEPPDLLAFYLMIAPKNFTNELKLYLYITDHMVEHFELSEMGGGSPMDFFQEELMRKLPWEVPSDVIPFPEAE